MQTIKQAAMEAMEEGAPVALMYGIVESASPLRINADQRLPLDEDSLILTSNVKDYKTYLSFDNPTIKNIAKNYSMEDVSGTNYKITFQDGSVRNEITIYNGLKKGEKVILLRIQGGQQYIVLDRA